MLNNQILNKSEIEDAYVLIHGMFAATLPPMIDEIMTKEALATLIEKIAASDKSTLFIRDQNTGLIKRLDNEICSPKYIYGHSWAAESIKFFTLKIDDSWRPLAIPNIKHALMFAYNSLIVAETSLNQLYSREDRLNGRTSHSESPIIGRDGIFSTMLYDLPDDEFNPNINEPVGYIGYEQPNKFFQESKLHKYRVESTYPYVLQVDLSKYFENIYTHQLANVNVATFQLSRSENSGITLQKYLEWLDQFNQKVNDDHTKGIIQGPISSKVSAEIFQLSLDNIISNQLSSMGIDVAFTRYVDDYRFFGKTSTDLELAKNMLFKVFRRHELSINESKLKLFKGFEVQKQANDKEYPELGQIIRGHQRITFDFDEYQILHEDISTMLQDNDLSTLKSVLTNLTNKTIRSDIRFKNEQIVLSLLEFLIKLAYVIPLICMQTYKLINEIIKSVTPAIRHECWNRLFSEFEYIRENYADTDFEIWYFYVLSHAGVSTETSTVVSKYLKRNDDLSPIVLTVLVKPRSKAANRKIEAILSNKITTLQTISQTKWWLPLSKLWIDSEGKVSSRDIHKLFLSYTKSSIQWDKLGIIEFLRQQVAKTGTKTE